MKAIAKWRSQMAYFLNLRSQRSPVARSSITPSCQSCVDGFTEASIDREIEEYVRSIREPVSYDHDAIKFYGIPVPQTKTLHVFPKQWSDHVSPINYQRYAVYTHTGEKSNRRCTVQARHCLPREYGGQSEYRGSHLVMAVERFK